MSLMSPLRGAILGYGHVAAEGHMPVWAARKDVAIVAVADADPARRERFLQGAPDRRAYADAQALLAAETLDFVDVCTPPNSHAALAQLALQAGLHVLCEKPLTTSTADAVAIAEAARRAGRVVHAVHNWLAAPICRAVTALVDEGAVGAVRSVDWATLRTRPSVAVGGEGAANWRLDPLVAGGGILLDHGWHAAYCVARWAGGPPARVSAVLEARRYRDLAVEDTADVALEFEAATGRIFLTWAAEARANTITIVGDAGRIEVSGAEIAVHTSDGVRRMDRPPALSEGSHHPDWFAAVVDDFLGAMTGAGPGNLAEAVMCARLMDRAQASSAAGGAWLPIDPGFEQPSHNLRRAMR